MDELSDATRNEIHGLMLDASGSKLKKITSYKSRRHAESKSILKLLDIKHGEKCGVCDVNCEVKHNEDADFWAAKEGLKPQYNLDSCPKQGRLARAKIKIKKRVK